MKTPLIESSANLCADIVAFLEELKATTPPDAELAAMKNVAVSNMTLAMRHVEDAGFRLTLAKVAIDKMSQ